ncbi:MAG: putative DNA-binding domain-containing protein [Pseudomonadota bacterium]
MTAAASLTAGLAHEQSLLLAALFGEAGDLGNTFKGVGLNPQRGLQALRANGEGLALRALTAAYPVTAELIGSESFEPLASYFWKQQPPQRGDIAQWGGGLPDFLDAAPQLAHEPFLGDVARIEWLLHCAATAADAIADVASLALLAGDAPGQPTLVLSDGAALLASDWPVVSIFHAHLLYGDEKAQALTRVGGLLQRGTGERALVWRQGFKPQLRLVSAAEYALLSALLSGMPLEDALKQVFELAPSPDEIPFDFSTWLGQAVQTGLVTGAINIDNNKEETS